jgi:anaerobic selenocysteine-containing dehydrogenase
MKQHRTACPLDCWDQCSLLVGEENGAAVSIGPDPDQPVTGKIICRKGRRHLERFNHPGRLHYPLLKRGGSFKRISWPEALQLMAEKISASMEKYGPLSLLHFYEGGHMGILKNLESRFFSALGGATTHYGNLCWGAGIAAQKYDFGAVLSHPFEDLLNSRLAIIWGRNPAYTSVHLLPFIRRAREQGTRLILIDPLRTATANLTDEYFRVKPGSDGALALGMANVLIGRGLFDQQFIAGYSSGFEQFAAMCAEYTPEKTEAITGLPAAAVIKLALDYAGSRPASILLGIGLQRHSNGCNTVRAIDALAAVSGNLGLEGGGVSYANFRINRYIDHDFISGADLNPQYRYYPKPKLAAALKELQDPPIDFLYISRGNPLVQVGDSGSLRRAMQTVPFIVTAEHFMTDTAAASDLVLPCTGFLEEEDLYYTSMSHHYLSYGTAVAKAPGECRTEYAYLKDLALLLGLHQFPDPNLFNLMSRAIKPLTDAYGITLDEVKKKTPLPLPGGDEIPWAGGNFETADGKFNFYSEAAKKDGGDGLPFYRNPRELDDRKLHEDGFTYWFVTPHARDTIHSTHRLPDATGVAPAAYLHPQTAEKEGLLGSEKIRISSKRGSIEAKAVISEMVSPDTVLVYQGWWHSSGAAVNNLTPDRLSDLGNQAAYYDCLCRIDPIDN